jgi:hypothetical protein
MNGGVGFWYPRRLLPSDGSLRRDSCKQAITPTTTPESIRQGRFRRGCECNRDVTPSSDFVRSKGAMDCSRRPCRAFAIVQTCHPEGKPAMTSDVSILWTCCSTVAVCSGWPTACSRTTFNTTDNIKDEIPFIETLLLDRKDLPSAGAGECPMIGLAPAIANAIFDATGVRLRSLPLIPGGLKLA